MASFKSVFLTSVLAITVIAAVAGPVFADQQKDFENSQWKYSVKYPGEFQLKKLGGVTVFASPAVDKKTGFSESVNIAVEDFPGAVPTLDEFFAKAKGNLALGGNPVKFLEEKKDKLGGADAYRIIYTSKQKKTNFKLLQVIAIYKNKVYVITYTALPEQFDRGLNNANMVIKSLKFTN